RRVDVRVDARPPFRRAAIVDGVVQRAQALHLLLSVPRDALAATDIGERSKGSVAAIGVRIITLDHENVRRGDAGDEVAFPLLPVFDLERLGKLGGRIVRNWA